MSYSDSTLMKWMARWLINAPPPAQETSPATLTPEEDPFTEPVELPITDVFDLHAIPPKQIKVVLAEYLLQARALGFHQVRLIHGKGNGTQRASVRSLLSRTPFAIEYRDAPPEAGGWGATIATLLIDQNQ